ncbi:MAG: DNA-directed RNA polymerase subunit omega [Lachnospiraceae bacterium]|jgi:DNA-directed RNA polymerase, omega subunit|nr:DNA-directed RNA polymerase subunit omega [Lachnospiraceae bacterium]MCI9470070.1 DNA-directed RNA polymerase subunit omega [Lachnospiraceae bacterium]
MIHPSYSELMQVVNKDTDADEPPVVNSRYSIVLATSKRARQIIGGDTPLVPYVSGKKPLSVAIDELYQGKVKIIAEDPDKESLEEAEGPEQLLGQVSDQIADQAGEMPADMMEDADVAEEAVGELGEESAEG